MLSPQSYRRQAASGKRQAAIGRRAPSSILTSFPQAGISRKYFYDTY